MSEEKGKGIRDSLADETKGLAVEVYRDGAKPTVTAVGDALGMLAAIALAPVHALAAGVERLTAAVTKRLERVPPDRQLPPPPTISAPAALHYALLGESDEVAELRLLFENLLVASMDRETATNVHPAFVSMISQMTPDEAWILKSITQGDYAACWVFEMCADGKRHARGFRTMLGRDSGIDESRRYQYLSNLDRLGVLSIELGRNATDLAEYVPLGAVVDAEFAGKDESSFAAVIAVTPLGQQFIDTCVRAQA